MVDAAAFVGYSDCVKIEANLLMTDLEFFIEVSQGNWASTVSSKEQAVEVLNCPGSNGLKQEPTLSPTFSWLRCSCTRKR